MLKGLKEIIHKELRETMRMVSSNINKEIIKKEANRKYSSVKHSNRNENIHFLSVSTEDISREKNQLM